MTMTPARFLILALCWMLVANEPSVWPSSKEIFHNSVVE